MVPSSRLVAIASLIAALAPAAQAAAAPACWRPPVDAPVVDPFREPACRWCPGNRGIEYGTDPGVPVRAVASGRVTYAGTIAGVTYVVVAHVDGHRATYGGVVATSLRAGEPVVTGMVVGRTAGRLHFGVRDADGYVDPAPLLGRLVRRPWLIPADGAAGVRPPRPALRCVSDRGPVLGGSPGRGRNVTGVR